MKLTLSLTAGLVVGTIGLSNLTHAFTPTIRFSEFLADAPGPDDGREFFEISGPAGASLDGLSIIEIDGDGGAGGSVDGFFDLSGLTLGSNGLLLLRDQEEIPVGGTPVPGVLNPAPAAETNVYYENDPPTGDYNRDGLINAADYTVYRDVLDSGSGSLPNDATPGDVSTSDYSVWADAYTGATSPSRAFFNRAGDVENGSITFVLARNFSGVLDMDLDVDNDGTLDSTPWDEVLDAVGFNEGPVPNDNGGVALNNGYAAQLGGAEFEGTLSGLDAVSGIAATLDGYVLLSDGEGGFIPTAFDPDESTESSPELFIDDGSGNLSPIDTSPLGPWSLDSSPGFPEMVTVDGSGALFFVDPETTLVTGEMLGAPGLSVVGADGLPISLYIVSPGNTNVSGTIGDPVPVPVESATIPEPSSLLLAVVALGWGFRRSERS